MLIQLDQLSSWQLPGVKSRRATTAVGLNRVLTVAILLFGLAVPHSIAGAQSAFLGGLLLWLGREILIRRPGRAGTWLDGPLFWFVSLTLLSSFLSFAPAVSLVKSKSLGLFLILHLVVGNLARRGAVALCGCLIISSLVGVGFSLAEKVTGRGMVIGYIDPASPLAASGLRPGDAIWMIARRRVASVEEMTAVIARHRTGDVLSVEALHAGDPVPVTLRVTESLRSTPAALGLRGEGRTRRFRVAGFTRQFITYAEQMQLVVLFIVGLLLAGLPGALLPAALLVSLPFFIGGLLLTATRSVIAACSGALVLIGLSLGGRRARLMTLAGAMLIGAIGIWVVASTRRDLATSFNDDSTQRRIGYMKAGLQLIPRHPLLGVGMDSHLKFWKEWGFPGEYITHTHSTPIQVALDRGLPALGSLIWMGLASWIHFQRRRQLALIRGDRLAAGMAGGALAALAGFSLSALTNYNFGDSETLMQLLALLGLAGAVENRPRAETSASE